MKTNIEERPDAKGLEAFYEAADGIVEEKNETEGLSEEIPRSPPSL